MITIGKILYSLLSGSTALTTKVGTRIYPLIVPQNTPSPLIVYERGGYIEYDKDGRNINRVDVVINIITDNYKDGIDIAEIVDTTLKNKEGTYLGVRVLNIELGEVDEDFINDNFIQRLVYRFLIL